MPKKNRGNIANPEHLEPFPQDDDRVLQVVIETPKGSRNKYKFDSELQAYRVAKVLPKGLAFPFDFGFVPGTKGDDGDPLDVLLLMDEPTFPGCVVEARLLGVLEAEQEEDGQKERNDRLIAVANSSIDYADIGDMDDLPRRIVDQVARFFTVYNERAGKRFAVRGLKGFRKARKQVQASRVRPKRAA